MLCKTTVSYEFCFNGSSIGPILPKRGLRQGDPLSPYLFIFCVKDLFNAIDRVSNDGAITSCCISPFVRSVLFVEGGLNTNCTVNSNLFGSFNFEK